MAVTDKSITRETIEGAYALILPYIRETPTIAVAAADFGLAGQPITFKLEFLQATGNFKARGAFHNLLTHDQPKQGVVAASGGNHGVAVAYAARHLGRRAKIFVPSISSPAKIDRIKALGAEIVIGGANYADALAASEEWIAQSGDRPVHAYDMLETIAGQGTIALELSGQAPEAKTVLVSVGGGGLIAGIAAWYRGGARIIGIEPERAPTLRRALDAGAPVDVDVSGLAADSLGARRLGSNVFPIVRDNWVKSLLVTDSEIAAAQRALWDVLRVVVEPGGAAAFAGLLAGRYAPSENEQVAVVLCGANTTAVHFDSLAA